jgi:hypothetical protein
MSDIAEHIEGAEKITRTFGYWPSFHDAEIINFHLWRGDVDPERKTYIFPALTLLIHVWELTNEVNPNGYLVCRHHTLATLRFHTVFQDIQMSGFNSQNAIFGLHIERKERSDGPSPYFEVNLAPAHGISASFTCMRVEVVEASPSREDEVSASL